MNPNCPELWGLGGVVATLDGVIIARVQSNIYCWYGSTTLLELNSVTELLHAARKALCASGHCFISVWPWRDNKGAVELSNS